jgi:hypothetical protein
MAFFWKKCPYCGAEMHSTYYHSEGGKEITRMFACGTVQKAGQEQFGSQRTSVCRLNEIPYSGVL